MLRSVGRPEAGFEIPASRQLLVEVGGEMHEQRHKPVLDEHEAAFLVAGPGMDRDRLQDEIHAAVL
jgi:hypothetical protein